MSPYLFHLDKKGKVETGYLSVLENKNLPFEIKRVYWVYDAPDHITRGNHASRNLDKVLIAVAGQVTVETESMTGDQQTFVLDSPATALFIPGYHWIITRFSPGAVLLVLASAEFSEDEYIKDYEVFKLGIKN